MKFVEILLLEKQHCAEGSNAKFAKLFLKILRKILFTKHFIKTLVHTHLKQNSLFCSNITTL